MNRQLTEEELLKDRVFPEKKSVASLLSKGPTRSMGLAKKTKISNTRAGEAVGRWPWTLSWEVSWSRAYGRLLRQNFECFSLPLGWGIEREGTHRSMLGVLEMFYILVWVGPQRYIPVSNVLSWKKISAYYAHYSMYCIKRKNKIKCKTTFDQQLPIQESLQKYLLMDRDSYSRMFRTQSLVTRKT